MIDPFAIFDQVENEKIALADEQMVIATVGTKVIGLNEGIIMGILIGYLLCDMING